MRNRVVSLSVDVGMLAAGQRAGRQSAPLKQGAEKGWRNLRIVILWVGERGWRCAATMGFAASFSAI